MSQLISGAVRRLAASLLEGAGAALVGTIQAGAGAVLRTVRDLLREYASPMDYGAVGNGIANDTQALRDCLAANRAINLGASNRVFRIVGPVAVPSETTIKAKGAKILQDTANTEALNIEGREGVRIKGVAFVGKGNDYSDSDSSRAVAIYGEGGRGVKVKDCTFVGFTYCALRVKATADVEFSGNTVTGPAPGVLTPVVSGRCYGVLADSGCVDVRISGNHFTKTAQGARIEGVTGCTITGNTFTDIVGQHGIYAGSGLTNITITGNTFEGIDLVGIKVQAQDAGGLDNRQITITGNTITNTGDQGILLCNGVDGGVRKVRGFNVSGNTIRNAAGSGITLNNCIGGRVGGNVVDGCGFSGISMSEIADVLIESNKLQQCGLSGMRDVLPCFNVTIRGNKVTDCATANVPGDRFGLFLQAAGTEYTIKDNDFRDDGARMQYGVYLAAGNMATVTLDRNQVLNATDAGLRLPNTSPLRSYRGNIWNGTLADTFNDPAPPTVASAASIKLPAGHDVVFISGTTAIQTIAPQGHSGRAIQLHFLAAGCQVLETGNVKTAGAFNSTVGAVLTIGGDGVNFTESARALH